MLQARITDFREQGVKRKKTKKSKKEDLCGFTWSNEQLLETLSVCVLLAPRSSWYHSITWALMQLRIRQHLRIMFTAVRLFIKYHQDENDTKQKYVWLLIKWMWVCRGKTNMEWVVTWSYVRDMTKTNVKCLCRSATLLAFLVELLKSSVAMQEQMLGGKGFLVIGYLLEKVSKRPHSYWVNKDSSPGFYHDSSLVFTCLYCLYVTHYCAF